MIKIEEKINKDYFNWLCKFVDETFRSDFFEYSKLFMDLYKTDFRVSLSMDKNRASDGINLRYRFGYEKNYSDIEIESFIDNRPCSVLEMIIALAVRMESIAENPKYGNRVPLWFWTMINNLGLSNMTDDKYDIYYVLSVINRLLNRDYEPNGKGGLFYLPNEHSDLRYIEFWYQACWYLNYILNDE